LKRSKTDQETGELPVHLQAVQTEKEWESGRTENTMKNDFTLAFNEIVDERALPREVVLEALSQALVSAYRRDVGISSNQQVDASIDPTGQMRILLEKEVVEEVESEQTEVSLEE